MAAVGGAVVEDGLAVGETVILLHPPLPLVGEAMLMERGCQQSDSLADGLLHHFGSERDAQLLACGNPQDSDDG